MKPAGEEMLYRSLRWRHRLMADVLQSQSLSEARTANPCFKNASEGRTHVFADRNGGLKVDDGH